MQESRRKAQEELAGANKAEKAAQKTVAALEKELAAASAKVTCQCSPRTCVGRLWKHMLPPVECSTPPGHPCQLSHTPWSDCSVSEACALGAG